MQPHVLDEIRKIIPEERILLDLSDRYSYSYDASFGQYLPDVVIEPNDAQEISRLVKLANQYRIPVYPRGAATSLSGGPLPVEGGMVLDMSRLNKKLFIDRENLLAIVSPGVKTAEIHKKAEEVGLFYPPDPSSSHVSTIGGNLMENSSGPKGLKYGTTKEYVIGLEVVTPTGDIIRTGGKTVKNVTGYDLTRLIVGSEGTLGIITEAILRLIPKPQARKTLLATFNRLEDSGHAITRILSSGILPAAMELMDNACIRSVENYSPCGLPIDAEALIIVEVDGHPKAVEEEIAKCADLCREQGAVSVRVARNEAERQEIWKARKMVSPAITQMGPTKISEDATVPRSQIPAMMKRLKEIRDKYQLNLVVFGHAGDGNLHPNIITDKRNIQEMKRVEDAVSEIFEAAVSLGGTLSGEHGIGTMKAPYMEMELGEIGLLMMKKIKQAWDPNNILNPGKIFPKPGQTKVVLTE
ncbi:FAD-binding protein [Brevibacillus sp. SYP-B805]|uniref:FAD-binding oxidoreductase n=1 Tax=Brevibacillus sp. SYP-B805 TaxID=1578199 RepID=UPI0013ECF5D8|nr:FAD-linked oxidase C-terminal domain-containing protein [Brevibacillus sp. SYP-B805]NGQ94964.1 FAD-binding protein [Brevibacillus sp. SYP-B805]